MRAPLPYRLLGPQPALPQHPQHHHIPPAQQRLNRGQPLGRTDHAVVLGSVQRLHRPLGSACDRRGGCTANASRAWRSSSSSWSTRNRNHEFSAERSVATVNADRDRASSL
jgi:hypothetical protein